MAHIIADGAGGAFFAWDEKRSGVAFDYDIYVQRIDREGNVLWALSGVPIAIAPGGQQDPEIILDGSGGVIIAWRDQRDQYYRVYAQRVNGDGIIQWATNGISVCESTYPQYGPGMVLDELGNVYVSWRDDRHGYGQVYCQKLDGSGNLLWSATGVRVCPTLGFQDWPHIIPDTKGGAIIAWLDMRYGFLSQFIYAQRLDANGSIVWNEAGAAICLFTYSKWSLECIDDHEGGGIVAWQGNGLQGGENVYAQRFDSTGAILWISSGVPVCEAACEQIHPNLISDDAEGAIISWLDNRDGRDDIYAQRVLSGGGVAWQTNGNMIRQGPPSSGFGYSVPFPVRDGCGGAILAWQEGPGPDSLWDIFSQRVDANGALLWPDSAVSVCRAPGGQFYPQITSNGEGGAIVVWSDFGGDSFDPFYAMRVTANGETVATLLQGFSARARGSSIVLEWRLADLDSDAKFHVLRSCGNTAYEEIDRADISRNGLSFAFTDKTCHRGVEYRYRIDVETGGERTVLFETEPILLPPLELSLAQNYPNPFNPSTTIRFTLDVRTRVRLGIFDCAGREIVRLIDEERSDGDSSISWDGRDARGEAVSTGIYFYRLTAGKRTITKKMVLLK